MLLYVKPKAYATLADMDMVSSDSRFRIFIERIKQRFVASLNWLKTPGKGRTKLFVAVSIITILIATHISLEAFLPEVKDPSYGVSFSVKYAKELGVDWQANFTALLDDMGVKKLRLMSYWDTIEAQKGKFTFQDLDWQMDEAHKRGVAVSLAIGLRQPRWPECHAPSWYASLDKAEKEKALLGFIEKVITRYRDHPAIESYQLENEAVNRHFGSCSSEDMDQKRLNREFSHAKSLDSHPVYMSLSDQHGLPLGRPIPDKYGFSVYRTVWNDKFGPFKTYVTYPTPVWYHRLRAAWIKAFQGKDIFIHELQLEPWGPEATKSLSVEEQDKSMSKDQIHQNIKFARKIGSPDIYLWGGEWWYWRKTNLNDHAIWEAVKTEINRD